MLQMTAKKISNSKIDEKAFSKHFSHLATRRRPLSFWRKAIECYCADARNVTLISDD